MPEAKPNPFEGWNWPVPKLADGRAPLVTSGYGPRDRNVYSCGHHLGGDIMFRWHTGDPTDRAQSSTRVDKVRGRFGFFMPSKHPIVATGPGTVIKAGPNTRGKSCFIDHGNTVVTWYQHLSELFVKKGDRVAAGQVVGLVGWDLRDAAASASRTALLHLHFEWLFKSKTHPLPTECHNRGKTSGLGFRAVCLDPEKYLEKIAHLELANVVFK